MSTILNIQIVIARSVLINFRARIIIDDDNHFSFVRVDKKDDLMPDLGMIVASISDEHITYIYDINKFTAIISEYSNESEVYTIKAYNPLFENTIEITAKPAE